MSEFNLDTEIALCRTAQLEPATPEPRPQHSASCVYEASDGECSCGLSDVLEELKKDADEEELGTEEET